METLKHTFEPDKELLDFATDFSNKWKSLFASTSSSDSSSDYFSKDKKYQLKYLDRIYELGGYESKTDVRVGLATGEIQISKSRLESLSTNSDYLFFVILWCVIEKEVRNAEKSDLITMEYYLKTGRSIRNVVDRWISLFSFSPSEQNTRRMEALSKFIKNESLHKNE